ncbi:MAG: HAMP domain-containing histidine kinase [Lachnospiraceae bacterium]|nr:HAMP domain-containing histidine kinase [Lachnospiraceae bacterium]
MKREVSGLTTRTYLRRKFVHVILATLGFVLLPIFLLVTVQWISSKGKTEYIPAEARLQAAYSDIRIDDIVDYGGGAMVVNKQYEVMELGGKPVCDKRSFSEKEWTEFLVSTGNDTKYQYDIAYDEEGEYWLVLRIPSAIRFSFIFDYNQEAAAYKTTAIAFFFICSVYFIALIGFVVIYSKRESVQITKSMEEISVYAEKLEDGDYSAELKDGGTLEICRLKEVMKHLASELNSKEEIQKNEEAKRMLLVSEISHDLKNPLASVQGYSEMLCKDSVSTQMKQKEYAEMIHSNAVRANELLQSLFTYSKLGSVGYTPELKKIDICEYTRLIFAEYIPRLEDAGFQYELNIPEEEICVNLDQDLFRRVYDNLIENSMKYNHSGTGIKISICQCKSVEIHILDDGVGIEDKYVEQIFNPFFRVDGDVRNSQKGGSGLGLAIVKQIVMLHNGHIEYLQEHKSGCGFRITLPL